MTERSIVEAAARLRRHGEPYLVATVVCVHGAAYRRPGARMLLTRFRWVAGAVSGGYLEGDISEKGWWRTRDGRPVLVTYDPSSAADTDDDIRSAFGLGCEGAVNVLLERAGAAGRIDALEFAGRCLDARQRGAIATVYRCDGPPIRIGTRLALTADGALEQEADPLETPLRDWIAADLAGAIAAGTSANRSYVTAAGTLDVLIEAVLPPPRLILCGTGHDAVPVAMLARSLGWDVIVCAATPRYSTRERFSLADEVFSGPAAELDARLGNCDRVVAIVMNHNAERDRGSLGMLLATRLPYIGVLGPRTRTRRLLRELGIDDEDPRVHAPVGLEIGAETPHETALAIIAELQAVVTRTSATAFGVRTRAAADDRHGSGSRAMAVAAPVK